MTIDEYVDEVDFNLPMLTKADGVDLNKAVMLAFREVKRYMRTSVDKTVPYTTRIDLKKLGIEATQILNVIPSRPRVGLTLGSIDSGNVFQIAAAVNQQSLIGNTSRLNLDPIISEMAMAQVRNTLSTDFQWRPDMQNQVIYCTHKDPRPATVTIIYTPDFKDVSEINKQSWIDYIIRLATARAKVKAGRARSKYRIEGSNVSNDGETLLSEGNAELEQIREELENRRRKLMVVT